MKTMRLLLMCSGLVLTGCGSANTSGIGIDSALADSGQPALQVDNPALVRDVELKDIKERYVGDLLQVQATLANQASRALFLQYKFYWFDASGYAVAPQQDAWIPLTLHGGQRMSVQGVAPQPGATRYQIYLREQSK